MTFYLTSMDTISLSRTVFEIFDFKVFRVWPWPLTSKSHLGSNFSILFESPYMTSYLTSMDTISLSRTVFEIFDFKIFRVWPWPLTSSGHLGSKNFIPFESPYMTFYLTSMDTISLSRTVFEIYDFKVFRVWPWPLTSKGHLGSNISILFESPYMTSYLTSMDTISLSRAVFEIFGFKIFRVWPWPLTSSGHLGSKNVYTIRKPIYDFSIWLLWTPSLYLVPFSRYSTSKFLGFDLDLWPLKVIWVKRFLYHSKAHIWLPIWLLWTPSLYLVPFSRYSTSKFSGFELDLWPLKGHLGSKNFIPFESPYMTFYLTSMDTISLSRTVFEIFDFKVFKVWPWPLTLKGHLRSNISILFENPYMTSYLTSMDTISLSRAVFEIFDFKIFRVWPWPLTSSDHLMSKNFIPFESPYMTFYWTSMDTISLSRTVILEIYDFKVFKVWPWPLTSKGQGSNISIRHFQCKP